MLNLACGSTYTLSDVRSNTFGISLDPGPYAGGDIVWLRGSFARMIIWNILVGPTLRRHAEAEGVPAVSIFLQFDVFKNIRS